MGLKDNNAVALNQKITKDQAEREALISKIKTLNAERLNLETHIAQNQALLTDISVTDKDRLERIIERLTEKNKALGECKIYPISRFVPDIQSKLSDYCIIANGVWLRDGIAIPYAELADTAELVEDAVNKLLALKDEKSDLKPLKEALNKIETKALTLDHSKNISRRKLGRVLLGIGIALTLTAIALLSVLLLPFAIGFSATFAVAVSVAFSGAIGPFSIYLANNFSERFKPAPLPKTLLLFRDTLKDAVSGDKPHKPSFGKRVIRAMR